MCADEHTTVDEEGGGSVDTDTAGVGHISFDEALEGRIFEVGLEALGVEAELFGDLQKFFAVEVTVISEKLIVVLPELALSVCGHGGDGCGLCVSVKGQRHMFEGETDLSRVGLFDGVKGAVGARAEGAFKVGEDHDSDGSVVGAPCGGLSEGDRDGGGGRLGCARAIGSMGACERGGLAREDLADGLLEACGGLCADDAEAVDKKGGGTVCTDTDAHRVVRFDVFFEGGIFDVAFKLGHLKADLTGISDKIAPFEPSEVREEFVVIGPELALAVCSHRSDSRRFGVFMKREGAMFEDKADLSVKIAEESVDGMGGSCAKGALEV